MNEPHRKGNYLRNTKASNSRTVRVEVMGDTSDAERNLLDGISFFVAATISLKSIDHTTYVVGLMTKLMDEIIAKLELATRRGNNMNENNNPFEEYYEKTSKETPKGQTAKEIIASLETKATEEEKKRKVTADANTIRGSINIFIKNMNALIGKVFSEEKDKNTRADLIVTMVIGGLAYTAANVFFLITKNMQAKMSADEYEATFMGMYRTAIHDIGKSKEEL